MSYKDEWFLLEAEDDIDEIEHREPTEEFLFYRAVAGGDLDTVRKNCEQGRFVEEKGVGTLSRDPVVNLKYHFVITTAMIARLCRQSGMELEQAFRLSDFYIQKLDDIHTEEEVHRLHDEMVMDYTEKMRKYNRSDTNSKHINACKEYIYSHIKERITIEDLADELGVSSGYLSRLFKKETGVSVSAYIRSQKIDMAKNLLRFSDYSMIDIANRLSFSSQSHFIQQFREVVGMTPKKYRDEYYMVQWDIDPVGKHFGGDGTDDSEKNIHESKVRDTVMIRTVSRALLCARRAHILTSTKEMNYAADDHMVRTISFSSARSSSGM